MKDLLQNPVWRGQLRHLLTFLAGIAVAKGALTQEVVDTVVGNLDTLLNALGIILGLGAALWSAKAKKPDSSETEFITKRI